ncbi:hypothetical protein Tco_0625475 [Tanacetum coccineum]|uniref:Uncharacterized protein n=1 Tax=Tanacetum coccineum TaxID=301880 RepID=A0ABQ4WGX7_9ASTR
MEAALERRMRAMEERSGPPGRREIWEAIRTRFGGNAKFKKMQKAVFKQQFEAFRISNSEGLEKGYDSILSLLSTIIQPIYPEKEVPLARFADEVIYSLFAKQKKDLDLLHEIWTID